MFLIKEEASSLVRGDEMGLIKYIIKNVTMQLSSKAEYRGNLLLFFFLAVLLQFTTVFITYSVVNITDNGFPEWDFYEIVLLIGVFSLGKGIYDMFFHHIKHISWYIHEGHLDNMLVKPFHPILQMIDFNIYEVFHIIGAFIMFFICIPNIDIDFSINIFFKFLLLLITSFFAVFSTHLIAGTTGFWIVKNGSIVWALEKIVRDFSKWPMNLYDKKLLYVFSFIFPVALVNYFPTSILLGKNLDWWVWLTPVWGIIYFLLSIVFFNYGLSNYSSTGT